MPAELPSTRPLLDKLGVRPGHRVTVLRPAHKGFISALSERGAAVSTRLRRDSDMIFLNAVSTADLARLPELRRHIKPDGAIWVIREKGPNRTLTEIDVIQAGLDARMVDNKIVSFSDTQGAMRLVIRLVDR